VTHNLTISAPAVPLGDTCAVVIAAGMGSRWRSTSADDTALKPLTPVLGVPLVVRTLATLRDEGVLEAIIVTGYRAKDVRARIEEGRPDGLGLRFVYNRHWRHKNGLSVLAAREAVAGRHFLLSMADHLYASAVVRVLRSAPRAEHDVILAVDYRTTDVNDPDDAMWVRLHADKRIRDIGKDLTEYHAVDTGVFYCTPALFEALEAERQERGGDCALADGVRRLARGGRAHTVDIGDAWWQDVDTRGDLDVLETKIRAAREQARWPSATPLLEAAS
jgi:choline kinase